MTLFTDVHHIARGGRTLLATTALAAVLLAGCSAGNAPPATESTVSATAVHTEHTEHSSSDIDPQDQSAAMLAAAGFQDVSVAEAAGYASSLDTLGCFQDPQRGGMGLHYIDNALLDDHVDITEPEALVYELDATGTVTGLVAHEYIVPVDAWTESGAPSLFGRDFHQHPTLPLWVLHAWLWKDNPNGMFADWNPAVRQCPAGVPIFGTDLPAPATTSAGPTGS